MTKNVKLIIRGAIVAVAAAVTIPLVSCKQPTESSAEEEGQQVEHGDERTWNYTITNMLPVLMEVYIDGVKVTVAAGETISGHYWLSIVIGNNIYAGEDVVI